MQVSGEYVESIATLCIFFTFSSILSALLHRQKRSKTSLLAGFANVCMIAGALVIIARNQLPEHLVFVLTNFCFEASLYCSFLAMLYFHQLQQRHRRKQRLLSLLWLGSILLLTLFPTLTTHYNYRMLCILPYYICLFGMMSWLAARQPSSSRPLSQSICIYLAMLGAACSLLRLLLAWSIDSPFPQADDSHRQTLLMNVTAVCLFGLALTLIFWEFENGTRDLQTLADIDSLTGLPNRRSFLQQCRQRLQQGQQGSLLIFDIDHFKQINDRYGHLAGDRVLRQLGEHLRGLARRDDLLCRYGGEEFCLLLQNADTEQAGRLAERLRSSISTLQFAVAPQHTLQITISIGGVALNLNTATAQLPLEQWLEQADRQLYQAKNQGRNRAIIAGMTA
ncbi:GGDEF domain-containing protein [Aquitalea palustris]|uniref:diguanylate cyclase n=1 Tax=Aquitalea palustris TaxID=2480983 RepID=A0A454JFL3_9NEIS|nr:GGDEF domain-containing protein [Aquitalea palustris]RMC94555.1 GGDEF domain-containing protein [Aquitalea palustris]